MASYQLQNRGKEGDDVGEGAESVKQAQGPELDPTTHGKCQCHASQSQLRGKRQQ